MRKLNRCALNYLDLKKGIKYESVMRTLEAYHLCENSSVDPTIREFSQELRLKVIALLKEK